MLTLDDFQALKRKVEMLRRRRDEAIGAYKQLLARLKEEFGCQSIEQAQELLTQLQGEERAALVKYTKAAKEFQAKYKEQLAGI